MSDKLTPDEYCDKLNRQEYYERVEARKIKILTPEEFTNKLWSNYCVGETINNHDSSLSQAYARCHALMEAADRLCEAMEQRHKYCTGCEICSLLAAWKEKKAHG